VECRCTHVDTLAGAEAEAYAAEHLRADGEGLVCPDTGARWRTERRDGQDVLLQVEPERHLSSRAQSDEA
jgi:hypothetical protein